MYVILVYDVSLLEKKGQKVLRNVFKICKKYLHHIQNSVFEGNLSEGQLESLRMELYPWIRDDKDSVIVFYTKSEKWIHKEFWGLKRDNTDNLI